MASIHKKMTTKGEVWWQAHYSSPDNKQRSENFARKTDAKRCAVTVGADLARHNWVDPQRGRHPFQEWAEKWISTTTHLKPKTRESYESILKNHLITEFGHRPIASIEHPEVLTFLSGLQAAGKGPGTVRNVRDVMRLIFKLAVSCAIKANPVQVVKAPRARKNEMLFLTEDQVMALANEIEDPPPL